MKTKAEAKKEINLLELVPTKNIDWEKNKEGFVVLLKPKFRHPFFRKHILPKLRSPHYQVKLDDVGSFFWESCDGRSTVMEIAGRMKIHFGEKIEPVYDRLILFLQNLEKNKFIRYIGL
ncbi:MAG: PqqD family protein [Candidatus Aminicenantes bacterium]|nr:PqqD family protein [Candidatus Aminicenantes bacterium]